ncbi:hypothetical protein [Nocardioides pocheonensis]|uniref:Uncharacterized protein n=1 Tax=Nocardioides pocheonensis TaxID=661485 RepID=A0A3N0GNC9_9ACTN|nr:hypothetical protein [Nocardioides pocheonensis]RNM13919.1 hypothetical protein EFL26_13280 [Nocardioides pocheonensis]
MNELFRFLMLRPADLPSPDAVQVLAPRKIDTGSTKAVARRQAVELLRAGPDVVRVEDLAHAEVALAVRAALTEAPQPLADVRTLVGTFENGSLDDLVGKADFKADEQHLADTLVATKLVSDSADTDARGLAAAAQGYDAIRRAAEGADPVALRPLQMPDFGTDARDPDKGTDFPSRRLVEGADQPSAPAPQPPEDDPRRQLVTRIDAAIEALGAVRAEDFHTAPTGDRTDSQSVARLAGRVADLEHQLGEQPRTQTPSGASQVGTPWRLASERVGQLPGAVRQTLEHLNIDVGTTALPEVMLSLHTARTEAMMSVDKAAVFKDDLVVKLGGVFAPSGPAGDYVGSPASGMPTGHGSIHPVGVGDLLMVKEHVLRYEGGELAHVENVLKSEHLERRTRHLERTETTVLTESETTKEEERDTQSTDRFSLRRETSNTVKQDTQFKAGVSVDAKYGPFVEVKANADFATNSSSESSTKQAAEFSKDVVARSVSKVVERVLERRTTTTLSEFEEKYSHGFDNTKGAVNISGVYQWVDKVVQAQVYNYGKRMLFDVTLPEPATAFIVAQGTSKQEGQQLVKPAPFTLTADQITESNYTFWAAKYDVTGVEAPPPPYKTVTKSFDGVQPEDPHESSKSEELAIDEGFQAKYALIQCGYWYYDGAYWPMMIGSNFVDMMGPQGYADMSGEVGSVAFSYMTHGIRDFAATVEVFCERTARAVKAWQLKAHDAITQGYQAKLQDYENKLAEAAAATGVTISGRNPMWNQRITTTELRKQCLTMLTAQQFEAFGALEVSAQGYPQPNLARADAQMPYVRFFEQAFEWEHLVYFFYPYFWGWKPAWQHRMLLDDVDPGFADFLRAGAGRVVFPVRPGFEAAVVHYLETGEIWNGGPPPDISQSTYVPIVKEIQEAQGAPGDEVAQGEPWLVRLPTTLVKLRADDALPEWHKVGEDWQPAN